MAKPIIFSAIASCLCAITFAAPSDPTPADIQKLLEAMSAAACSAPPYGGTIKQYKRFIARWKNSDVVSLVPILENMCRAKFGTASRRPLYSIGLTDAEISTGNPISLADQWMRVTIDALKNNTSSSPDVPETPASPAPLPGEKPGEFMVIACGADGKCERVTGPFMYLSMCKYTAHLFTNDYARMGKTISCYTYSPPPSWQPAQ